jgi:hypothetical protein
MRPDTTCSATLRNDPAACGGALGALYTRAGAAAWVLVCDEGHAFVVINTTSGP